MPYLGPSLFQLRCQGRARLYEAFNSKLTGTKKVDDSLNLNLPHQLNDGREAYAVPCQSFNEDGGSHGINPSAISAKCHPGRLR